MGITDAFVVVIVSIIVAMYTTWNLHIQWGIEIGSWGFYALAAISIALLGYMSDL
jgi:hypothetical protein